MIFSSSCSFIWPCATAIRASGTNSLRPDATLRIDCTLLCTKNTCPSQQLAADGGGHLLRVVGADEREHRVPLLRRGQDRGHLADTGNAHLQRPRDRGRGHAEHV